MKYQKNEQFIYKCPHCGGNSLHSADNAIVWYQINQIGTLYDVPTAGGHEHLDYQQETCLGYRCGDCSYPDHEDTGSFIWKSIQDAIDAGAVIPDPMYGKRRVNCLVFLSGGHTMSVAIIIPQDMMVQIWHKAEIIQRLVPEGFSNYTIVLSEDELKHSLGGEQRYGMIELKHVYDLSDFQPEED